MPKGNTAEATSATEPVNEGAATKALSEATALLAELKTKLQEAGLSGDISAMVELAGKVRNQEAAVTKAERAVKDAEYNRQSEARMAASLEVKALFKGFLDGIDIAKLYGIGLRGISATFNEDFSVNINVQGMTPPSQAAKVRKESTNGTGGGEKVPRSSWLFNGRAYTSRELLETFGGEKGQIAVRRTIKDDPEYGYGNKLTASGKPATNPGFDVEVKALAKKMGWDGEGEHVLTHEPAAE